MSNDYIATQILKIFANAPFTAFNYKQISSKVGAFDKASRQMVQALVLEMAENKILVEEGRGKYKINPKHINDDLLPKNYVVGTIDMKQTALKWAQSFRITDDPNIALALWRYHNTFVAPEDSKTRSGITEETI